MTEDDWTDAMVDGNDTTLIDRWFPVARADEAVPRHVIHAQLLGQELAVWRDDAGLVNAWENRCPHRGVRLSIGHNLGTELRCQYHGWRFASGSGQCTLIPAHPDQKPPNVIRATPFGCAERYGFVWVRLAGEADAPPLYSLDVAAWTTLRSIFVAASTAAVSGALIAGYPDVDQIDEFILESVPNATGWLIFLLQPVTAGQTLVHALLAHAVADSDRLAVLRHHNDRLSEIRDAIERG
jgi:nitrite reductase/ring-hydroxylating ferredoxin subunit